MSYTAFEERQPALKPKAKTPKPCSNMTWVALPKDLAKYVKVLIVGIIEMVQCETDVARDLLRNVVRIMAWRCSVGKIMAGRWRSKRVT